MADSKITALTAISTVDPTADPLVIVDVSDTSMAASGTTKKSTINQLLGSGGTATLASATITGDLTAARLIVTGGTIPTNGLWLPTTNTLEFAANSLAQYRIAPLGVFNWYDGAGGTRMTLNANGLGIGVTPVSGQKLTVLTNIGVSASTATAADDRLVFSENMGSVNLGSQIVWQNSSFLTPYASIGVSNGAAGSNGTLIFSTCSSIFTNTNTERVRIKPTGQVRFFPLAADPAGAEAGDVYYNSSSNKLKCYNGSTWNDLF